MRGVVGSLGQIEAMANISRLDICVDFVTDYPLHLIRDEDWITRAKIIDRYTVNREFSGFIIGAGGVLRCPPLTSSERISVAYRLSPLRLFLCRGEYAEVFQMHVVLPCLSTRAKETW